MATTSSRRSQQAAQHVEEAATTSRAGRNLPAAVGVGLALGAAVIASLVVWKAAFLLVVAVAVGLGAWELTGALRSGRIRVPTVPVVVAAVLLPALAYVTGPEGLALGYGLSLLMVLVWRSLGGLDGAVRDVAGGAFVLGYVPLMAGTVALMLAQDDGAQRVLVFLIVTVASDIGGYAVGVLAGRHPIAPSVSPKKSWEGLAGSVATCVVAGAVSVALLLEGPWWAGAVLGVLVAAFATVGDFAESSLKRDLGIKDMGSLLPGHGGVMDRLDSLVVTAPVTWLLLGVLVPA